MALTDGTRDTANAHWIAATLAVATILGMWLFLPIPWIWDMNDPEFMPLVLLVPILAVYGAYHAARGVAWTVRARKFGESSLDIRGGEGRLGRPLEGVVKTSARLRPAGPYRLVLRCLETHTMRSPGASVSNGRHARDYVVWEQAIEVPPDGVDSTRGIPFSFQLPEHVREPEQAPRDPNAIRLDYAVAVPLAKKIWTNKAASGVTWQLTVSAPVDGADYTADFAVPVARG